MKLIFADKSLKSSKFVLNGFKISRNNQAYISYSNQQLFHENQLRPKLDGKLPINNH